MCKALLSKLKRLVTVPSKSNVEGFIVESKQIQKAGDGSQQVQAQNVYIVNGISEQRVREICSEIAVTAIANNSMEASGMAMQRIERFVDLLLPRIQRIEKDFDSFSDPAFQVLLRKAQLTAACTERDSDYNILSELLIHRINNKTNIKKKASIAKAVEIIDQVDDDSLCAITVLHAVTNFVPLSGNIVEGIGALGALYDKLDYENLPKDKNWVDNLAILGCMTTTPFFSPNSCEERFCKSLDGYMCVGLKEDSEEYQKALNLLNDNQINKEIFVDHELNEGYVRLPISQKGRIDELQYSTVSIVNGVECHVSHDATEEQKKCLMDIYNMYSNDATLQNQVKSKFIDALMSYNSIKAISAWWNDFNTPFSLTSIGRVIAHANAQRIDNTLPNMD